MMPFASRYILPMNSPNHYPEEIGLLEFCVIKAMLLYLLKVYNCCMYVKEQKHELPILTYTCHAKYWIKCTQILACV
jgi:hypothetical protein